MNTTAEPTKRTIWQKVFTSPNEARLRAGWRILLQTLLLMVISVVIGIFVFIPIGIFNIEFNSPLAFLANQITNLIGVTGSIFLARRFLDKRSIVSLGLKFNSKAIIEILVGIVITILIMGLIFAIEIGQGWTSFSGFAWQTEPAATVLGSLGLWLAIFIIVGWQEELLSRGYHLQSLESGINVFWAVILSSSIFAILHIFNPGANWASTLGILLAGLFLALPYILTRQLWLSIGLHIGWNFSEGVVFGFPVSGIAPFPLLKHTVSGPVLWTGGAFGPEAGLVVIPALLVGSILILGYTRYFSHKTLVD